MSVRKMLVSLFVLALLLTQGVYIARGVAGLDTGKPGAAGGPQTHAIVLSDMGLDSKHPVVAYNSTRDQYLAVWYNDRPGNDDIQGQRVDRNGKPLGGQFFISAGADHDRRYPDVAYDSKNDQYLVVWEDYDQSSMVPGYGIYGRRVSGMGVVMDATDLIIRSRGSIYSALEPVVEYSFTSNQFLVVWTEAFHPTPFQKDIIGQVVGPNGANKGGQILISNDPGNGEHRQNPAVAYNRHANGFLVVFEQRENTTKRWDIYGQILTGDGAPLKSNFNIDTSNCEKASPQVAALPTSPTDDKYMVTYEYDAYLPGTDIVARRIKENGDLNPSFWIASSNKNKTNPAIAANESKNNYLISWTEPDPQNSIPYVNIIGKKIHYDESVLQADTFLSGEFAGLSASAAGTMGDYFIVHEDQYHGYHILGILYRDVDWTIFQDVGASHWAFDWINRLYAAGVTTGCSLAPLNYCPEQAVSRAEMAKFLLMGVHGPYYTPPPVGVSTGFNDVSPGFWAAAWIKQLAAEGITSGCGGGNYCPNANVTRAEMAKFLLSAKHGAGYSPPPVGSSTLFNDVPLGYWAAAWIKQLYNEGITTGCEGGNYCPNANVTRAEMATFLVRTFELP